MSDDIIPPSPTKSDYTQSEEYKRAAKANAEEIFDQDDPLALFKAWMAEARASELNDSNAMALASTDANGMPDIRMVLLKDIDERGFSFFTNLESEKSVQLKESPKAALCFHWKSLRRQVRVRGDIEPVSDADADAYFASRARGSQLGAWSSDQSRAVESRAELEAKVKATEARFEGRDIPRPDFWGGWRLVPHSIEFWRDRPYRLHDRLVFKREDDDAPWTTRRLFP